MKLIAGTVVYEISGYLEKHFSGFLHQAFLEKNIKQLDDETYLVAFQNNNYKIKVETLSAINCNAISIYSDFSNKVKLRGIEIESNVAIGIPKLIRQQLISLKSLEWYDCKMLEPKEFEQTKNRIEEREISFRDLRKLYSGHFNENSNFKDCTFNIDLTEIQIEEKIITENQPWTLKIVESQSKDQRMCEFFIKVGIELDWDNTIYFDTYFIPIYFDEMAADLRIKESKTYLDKLIENEEIKKITVIEKGDELSFIIKTNKRYVFLQEYFWWS